MDLVKKALETLPGEIYEAEKRFYEELSRLRELRIELLTKESELFRAGKIKGQSDKVRCMQLNEYTKDKAYEITRAEFLVDMASTELNRKRNELEATLAIAKLNTK
ncbi:hypothetical protein [Bacillus sp. JJ1562]|uniref:hypothetical protein n=1 Tax=Bacillus sp. JJ1562 TaxID=3122960 RepID=UPI003001F861